MSILQSLLLNVSTQTQKQTDYWYASLTLYVLTQKQTVIINTALALVL